MCRLFALSGGHRPIGSTFWLLQAPDSLSEQSRHNPDGAGIGWFDERDRPHIDKQPLAAFEDRRFACEAKRVRARTTLAHVRHASGTPLTAPNTHPFEQRGRLFAHNGVLEELSGLEQHLGSDRALIKGDTDSERLFALLTHEIDNRGGAVGEGIAAAARWAAEHTRVFSLNLILIEPEAMWALRYPATNTLWVLERSGGEALEHVGDPREIRVHAADAASQPAVVLASEPMDDDGGWRELESGELLHVDRDLRVHRSIVLDRPPAHQLTVADLAPASRASQKS